MALFDSMRDTEAPTRWVYQQNKTTFEIVLCTFSSSRPVLPGTKRGPCGAVILGFYEIGLTEEHCVKAFPLLHPNAA